MWTWFWENSNTETYSKYGLHGSFIGDPPRVAVGDVYTRVDGYAPLNYIVTAIDKERKFVKMELNQR